MNTLRHLENCIEKLFAAKNVENIIVRVGRGEDVLYEIKRSSQDRILTERTLFDMASVTKIVATTSLALIAMDRGMLAPDDSVGRFLPVPEDKRGMTVRHLMTHTMGIGHKNLTGCAGGYADIADYILGIPSDIPIGTEVRYSCPGFILLGKIVEKLFDCRLNEAFDRHVAHPLGLASTAFLPDRGLDIVNSNRDESMAGLVNDYNCRYLGGVCGNAGLFSNLEDMTVYVKMLLAHGAPLLSRETFERAAYNYTAQMSESRGLGFLYVDERYAQAGGLFRTGSIGHCGHTGQSVFVDTESGLYVIILSDATVSTVRKYGKEKYSEVTQMRRDIHATIGADLDIL